MTKTSLFKFITTHCQRLVSWETKGQKFDRKVLENGLYKQEVSESFPFFLRGGSWFGYLHSCFVLVKVKETMGIEKRTSPCFNAVIEIELQNALGDLYWCKLSWFWVSSLHCVFVCSSVLSLLPFSWVSLTMPVYGYLSQGVAFCILQAGPFDLAHMVFRW